MIRINASRWLTPLVQLGGDILNAMLTPSSPQLPGLVEPHLLLARLPQPLSFSSSLQDRRQVAVWLKK